MNADYIDLLELFNQHGVTYLIVGGYAVIFHAEPRATKDLDVFVATNEDNARAVCDALREFGAPMNDITVDDFTHPDRVIQIGIAPVRIDIKTRVEGVEFADAWAHRVEGEANGYALHSNDLRLSGDDGYDADTLETNNQMAIEDSTSRKVQFRLSEAQWQQLCKAAQGTGITPHEWCRALTLNELDKGHGLSRNEQLIYEELARTYYLVSNAFGLMAEGKFNREEWQKIAPRVVEYGNKVTETLLLKRLEGAAK